MAWTPRKGEQTPERAVTPGAAEKGPGKPPLHSAASWSAHRPQEAASWSGRAAARPSSTSQPASPSTPQSPAVLLAPLATHISSFLSATTAKGALSVSPSAIRAPLALLDRAGGALTDVVPGAEAVCAQLDAADRAYRELFATLEEAFAEQCRAARAAARAADALAAVAVAEGDGPGEWGHHAALGAAALAEAQWRFATYRTFTAASAAEQARAAQCAARRACPHPRRALRAGLLAHAGRGARGSGRRRVPHPVLIGHAASLTPY
jgi:hypothetical protein